MPDRQRKKNENKFGQAKSQLRMRGCLTKAATDLVGWYFIDGWCWATCRAKMIEEHAMNRKCKHVKMRISVMKKIINEVESYSAPDDEACPACKRDYVRTRLSDDNRYPNDHREALVCTKCDRVAHIIDEPEIGQAIAA